MIADDILKERYYQEGEGWKELCERVAGAVAQGDAGKGMEEIFFDCLYNKKFLPNSPTLMNAGTGTGAGTLSACFVIPVEDDLTSIMNTVKNFALIGKSGGGVGCNWSKLRPAGSKVGSTNGVASGAVSFLEMVNSVADTIKQGGRRRIAIMSVLNVDHPDIKQFITAKTDSNKLNNMNMSVMIDDRFMQKVEEGDTEALDVWNLLIKQAWSTGEPGVLFYDTINADNILPSIPIVSTNPCGEQPLIPYNSCNLLSIDVSKLVINGKFDWNEYKHLIKVAVAFADATIDVNVFPLEEIERTTKQLRSLGLGVMGFASALIKMEIVYGSKESYEFADKLTHILHMEEMLASEAMARELGEFPAYEDTILSRPRRNATLTSIAPTGTIATISSDRDKGGTSFSIEPLFNVAYTRKVLGKEYVEVDPLFEHAIKDAGLPFDEIIELVKGKNSIQGIKEIPEGIRKLFVTAHDLTPEQHVRMVSTIQTNIDTGVSKTVNVPANFTIEETDKLFKLAYKLGCKGITIYRDGSREVPITTEKKVEIDSKAPDITFGVTERIGVACGHFLCNVSGVDEQPLKVVNSATTGCCEGNLLALQRIISLALRSGIKSELVTKQLDKVTCSACMNSSRATSKSCAAGISEVIKLYNSWINKDNIVNIEVKKEDKPDLITCPECGEKYMANTKCGVCMNCGYSRCG